jgi:hypothetical protein
MGKVKDEPIGFRVGNKKPAQKNPPNKTQKTRLKKPTSKWVFWVLLGFFKTDLYFLCKSHYFSNKMSLEEF